MPVFGVILVRIFPHSVRMRENVDQNNSKYGHLLHSDGCLLLTSGVAVTNEPLKYTFWGVPLLVKPTAHHWQLLLHAHCISPMFFTILTQEIRDFFSRTKSRFEVCYIFFLTTNYNSESENNLTTQTPHFVSKNNVQRLFLNCNKAVGFRNRIALYNIVSNVNGVNWLRLF